VTSMHIHKQNSPEEASMHIHKQNSPEETKVRVCVAILHLFLGSGVS